MTGDPVFDWADSELSKTDATALDYWEIWKIVDPLSIQEAARLLAGLDPKPSTNRIDSNKEGVVKAGAYEVALIRAVQGGRVHSAVPLTWQANGYDQWLVSCDPASDELCSETKIPVADLVQWAHSCGLTHHWSVNSSELGPGTSDLSRYPDELRAAIEAFEAVREVPKATAGKSAKQALASWLEANKPLLSANARDRIATVANWQQVGGAPKTPGD